MTTSAERRTLAGRKKRSRDPFRYGWRYVRHQRADGTAEFKQVPLSLDDFLHPEEEDFRVQSSAHNDDCSYLKHVIHVRLPHDCVVLPDCRVDWGVKGIRPHGPDIVVFRGLRQKKDWATFRVAHEKARPVFVIEITSPDTRTKDLVDKVEQYYRAGVPLYFIVDVYEETEVIRQAQLIGYRRGKGAYARMKPDHKGRFPLKPLGILLGFDGGRTCCFDAQTEEKIGDYAAIARERDEARKTSEEAQERISQLEAELRRRNGES